MREIIKFQVSKDYQSIHIGLYRAVCQKGDYLLIPGLNPGLS